MPEVRLLEYAVQKDAVSVPRETGIVEVDRPDGRVGRYLRTDGFDPDGRRLYLLVGSVAARSSGCPTCNDPWDVYRHGVGDRLASDDVRHSLLLRCPDCGSLFEAVPEERRTPRLLSVDDARRAFPGAL